MRLQVELVRKLLELLPQVEEIESRKYFDTGELRLLTEAVDALETIVALEK